MDADRFDQIQTLFLAALDRPPEERSAFLDEACSDDPDLRRAVETYLAADTDAEDFLLDQPLVHLSPADGSSDADIEGRQVGPYRLIRLLGRGGMGAVYLAERDHLERPVALKLVRGDLADPAARQRFLFERRVLARLEHPGIARLYDVGVDDDGTPFFAMEVVEGEPLTDYCDRERLGIADRLRVFERVGQAVQHAHQHFVVHRDLKPSNVLVTPEGKVKLLDFGIAKALDEAEDDTGVATVTGRRLLTPAYAAPEQVTGGAVTAATDVYALGVMLYELLTGQRPYEVDNASAHAVLAQEAKRPSTAVTERSDATTDTAEARATTPDRLARRLRGDLDVICLKALAKEPEHRYASAEAFVEDIKRHLAGLPVTARPASAGYRLRKFAERHRQGVLASVLGVLILTLVIGFYTVRLQAERDTARLEAEKAEEVTDFLLDLLAAAEPETEPTDTLTVRTLLAEGTQRIDAMENQPEVQVQMLRVMGTVYFRLGQYEQARPLFEHALTLKQELHGEESLEAAESLNDLGELERELADDLDRAEEYHRQALAIRRLLLAPDHTTVGESLNNLAMTRSAQGDLEDAERLFQEALRILEKAPEQSKDRADVYSNLSVLFQDQGRYEEAKPLQREALRLWQTTLGETHGQVALGWHNLGLLNSRLGDYATAESLYAGAIDRWSTLYGENHLYVSIALNNLGLLLDKKGDYAAAESVMTDVAARFRQQFGPTNTRVAIALGNLGTVLTNLEKYAEAETLHREELAIKRIALEPDHPLIATGLHNLGRSLALQEQHTEAEVLYREALVLRLAALGPDHPDTAATFLMLGRTLLDTGRTSEAEEPIQSAMSGYRAALGDDHPILAVALATQGLLLTRQAHFEAAEGTLREALAIAAPLGEEHRDVQAIRRHLTSLYEAWDHPEGADRR